MSEVNSEFGWLNSVLLLWNLGEYEQLRAESSGSISQRGQQIVWQLQETWALQVEFSSSILLIAA